MRSRENDLDLGNDLMVAESTKVEMTRTADIRRSRISREITRFVENDDFAWKEKRVKMLQKR